MQDGEWVWADSAYPVCQRLFLIPSSSLLTHPHKIDTWIVSPYKKPEQNLPDNEVFNNHVSRVQIQSEHAIGYLKGCFHSLKNLHLKIKDKATHILATYWIAACIGVHNFAM